MYIVFVLYGQWKWHWPHCLGNKTFSKHWQKPELKQPTMIIETGALRDCFKVSEENMYGIQKVKISIRFSKFTQNIRD